MKNESSVITKPNSINGLEYNQAIIGLELGDTDQDILEYVDYFTGTVPVNAAYFIHVVPKFDIYKALFEKHVEDLSGSFVLDEDLVKRMKAKVDSIVKKYNDLYVEYDIIEGNPLEELLGLCEKTRSDLIVIGQKEDVEHHGILGKNLASKTSSDALIIPEKATARISRILVPIDFSMNSARALQKAIALCKRIKNPCEVVALHVYSAPNMEYWKSQNSWMEYKEVVEKNMVDGFEAFMTTHAGKDAENIARVLVGKETESTARAILDFADMNKMDFITLGVKGHTKVHRMLIGSVAEKFLNINKSIPALIVK